MAEEEVEAASVEAEVDTENPEPAEDTGEETTEKKESDEGGEGAAFSPIAIVLRLLQMTLAIITFAVMASVDNFNNFNGAASFNLIVAVGVLITAWTLLALILEFGRSSALAKAEAFIDYIFSLLAFGSFCAAGAIQSKIVDTIEMRDSPKIICSIFFMMFTWMAMSILPIMAASKSWFDFAAGGGTAMSQTLSG